MSNPDWNPYPDRWWLTANRHDETMVSTGEKYCVIYRDVKKDGRDWFFSSPALNSSRDITPFGLPMEYCL